MAKTIMDTLFKMKNGLRNVFLRLRVEHIGQGCHIEDVRFVNGKKRKHKGISIGDNCVIRSGCYLVTDSTEPNSGIIMKKGSGLNRCCYVGGEGGVIIGKNAQIGPRVCFAPGEHTFADKNKPIKKQKIEYRKTVIGDDVWIGANATIRGGVKIGEGAVIGAGSVVVKDIPAYCIAYGVPAKAVRERGKEKKT